MSNNINLKRGLDIPISGEAAQKIKKAVSPDVVAVKPTDFRGLLPKLLVKEGDKVLAGTPVLADKKSPDIVFASPVSGTVETVVRGEKRKLLEVRIKADKTQEYVVGQKQYERPKPSANYGSQQGMGIDLDDLNRELSKEIQRIYNDENSGQDN